MSGTLDFRHACDERFPGLQVLRLVRRAVERHRLDLTGLRVLTESGVGYRRVTAVLAALAGAEAVYAVGRDSQGVDRRRAEEQTLYLAALAGIQDRVHPLATRLQAPLAAVDIVTDLPGVRPIDESVVRIVAETAAVSLMRSTASWRSADVDVATCRRRGIAVAGVDEDAVGLYRYLPLGIVWGLITLGVEVTGATIVVAGRGDACANIVHGLARLGARVLVAGPDSAGRIGLHGGHKVGEGLADAGLLDRLAEADALVLCPGSPGERWVGSGRSVDANRLATAAPHLAVVCEEDEADCRALAAAGLRCWPAPDESDTLVELLPQPLIDLHAAGLKVGEVLTRARRRGSSPLAAEQLAAAEAHAELLPKDLAPSRR